MEREKSKKARFTCEDAISMLNTINSSGSELDDSDSDDFVPDEEETSSGEDAEQDEDPCPDKGDMPTKRRNKRPAKDKWKQNVPKQKRLRGEAFKNRKGKDRPAKIMGPPCQAQYCQKSKLRRCESLTEQDRQGIFDRFWGMDSWETRKTYVTALIDKVDIKQKKTDGASRRGCSFSYTLKLQDGSAVPVCKALFCTTFALSQRTIGLWMKATDQNNNQVDSPTTPKSGKHAPVSETAMQFLTDWLGRIPTVPSHYCRNIPAYQDKKFLFQGSTLANLHRDYMKAAEEASVRHVSSCKFQEVFKQEGYSMFIPRKDRCDTCIAAELGNVNDDKHKAHLKAKEEARAEKVQDKEAGNNELSVWTMDLQAVMICPKTTASALYYKTKLQTHNFTLFDLNTKEGYCYPWVEHQGDLGSEVFASLQYRHFDKFLTSNPNVKELRIWSDGCGYQNRNAVVSNAYLHLAINHQVTVVQKFLVAGHTQMECDSMHSCIERKLVCDIYTPRDYIVIMQSARICPFPYRVHQITHDNFFKLSGSYVASIRPGKKTGDATVHELRALKYKHSGEIQYKLAFSPQSEWEVLPQRVTIPPHPLLWVRLFDGPLPIKERKYTDLQSMKYVLPQDCHTYYDSLPH